MTTSFSTGGAFGSFRRHVVAQERSWDNETSEIFDGTKKTSGVALQHLGINPSSPPPALLSLKPLQEELKLIRATSTLTIPLETESAQTSSTSRCSFPISTYPRESEEPIQKNSRIRFASAESRYFGYYDPCNTLKDSEKEEIPLVDKQEPTCKGMDILLPIVLPPALPSFAQLADAEELPDPILISESFGEFLKDVFIKWGWCSCDPILDNFASEEIPLVVSELDSRPSGIFNQTRLFIAEELQQYLLVDFPGTFPSKKKTSLAEEEKKQHLLEALYLHLVRRICEQSKTTWSAFSADEYLRKKGCEPNYYEALKKDPKKETKIVVRISSGLSEEFLRSELFPILRTVIQNPCPISSVLGRFLLARSPL